MEIFLGTHIHEERSGDDRCKAAGGLILHFEKGVLDEVQKGE